MKKRSYIIIIASIVLFSFVFYIFFEPIIKNYKQILLFLGITVVVVYFITKVQHYLLYGKKYINLIDGSRLPKKGDRTAFLGKVTETHYKSYFQLDKLTTHAIIAGATGSGKTVAAQGIAEEALINNIAVVVFDPTAQWTGFLRKCTDKKMLVKYFRFGMRLKSARAFNGNLIQILNSRQKINFDEQVKPGQITVFTLNRLDPKETDMFVASTIRQIFKMSLEESAALKTLFIYDEVHRLLPKFGGSGAGFIQIERGCREFRKWGIGLVLISQVLSDFVGEIKANISTEIQMRTRDERDLERIKNKYGDTILNSLIRASTGVGMLENPEYNKGMPYLVTFRPLLHNTRRLGNEELERYFQLNNLIADIDYEIFQLKESNQETFDLEIQLKLARDKLREGKFGMVKVYLDGLRSNLTIKWGALNMTPRKRVVELVPEEEILESIEVAKLQREEAMITYR